VTSLLRLAESWASINAAGPSDTAAGPGDTAIRAGETATGAGQTEAGTGDTTAGAGNIAAKANSSRAGTGDTSSETRDTASGLGDRDVYLFLKIIELCFSRQVAIMTPFKSVLGPWYLFPAPSQVRHCLVFNNKINIPSSLILFLYDCAES
jgi:hypothetical protein